MGISPFGTAQFTIITSPELIDSSPKSKGEICGRTVRSNSNQIKGN